MPESLGPTFVRVKDKETKHEYSVVTSAFDEKYHQRLNKPAVHTDGTALPPKHYIAAADLESADYSSQKKAELQAEIDHRNEIREEHQQIVPEGKGNVADLVAALEADDAAQADAVDENPESLSSSTDAGESAGVPPGQQAESDKEEEAS